MKNKKKTLFLLTALFAVVVAGIFLSVHLAENKDEDTSIPLFTLDTASVSEISCIRRGERTVIARDQNGAWYCPELPRFPLDQNAAVELAEAVSDFRATREVKDDPGQHESWGLADPYLTLKVKSVSGEEYTALIGKRNSVTTDYYMSYNGGIYMLSSAFFSVLDRSPYDMIVLDTFPYIEAGKVTKFGVYSSAGSVSVEHHEGGLDGFYTDYYEWYASVGGGALDPVDEVKVETFVKQFETLAFSGAVEYRAETKEELAPYGLAEGAETLYIEYSEDEDWDHVYKECSLTLHFGGTDAETGRRYVRMEGSGMVFLMEAEAAERLLSPDGESFAHLDVCRIQYGSVDSIDVGIDGVSYHIDIERPSAGAVDADIKTYIDGVRINQYEVKWFFNDNIRDVTAERRIEGAEPSGEAYITISFHRNTNDEYSEMKLEYYQYDSSFYLVSFNGKTELLVNKNYVKTFVTEFEELLKKTSE